MYKIKTERRYITILTMINCGWWIINGFNYVFFPKTFYNKHIMISFPKKT